MNYTELKCARIRRKRSTSEMARLIGRSDAAWNQRERGETEVSLKEARDIGRELGLTKDEFFAIFFDGELPFRNE